MTDIRPKDLPAVTAPTAGDKITLDGTTTRSITVENLGSSGFLKSNSQANGYTTGAGGAVTQITSRTTGVTLNKACGAITLFAAAPVVGTWLTFVVTNSFAAATDTVILSVKSAAAANKYNAVITAVSAGSFEISFASMVGTTSDSPVINFAVIKAVAS